LRFVTGSATLDILFYLRLLPVLDSLFPDAG
jgi:hypothetical protein